MSKLYNEIKKGFTITPNELIDDETIDARARFLFVWLLSKPDGWKYYNKTIEKKLGIGKDLRLKLMRELKNKGWLTVHQQKVVAGKFGHNDIVLHPQPVFTTTVPEVDLTAAANNGGGGNQPHNNKDSISNKDINNKKDSSNSLFGNEVFLPADVLNYLNEKLKEKNPARRGFGMVENNLKYIKALCKNKAVNYTLTDFKEVIDYKITEWYGKEKTEKWLRPSTLFGEKFDTYLTQALSSKGVSAGDDNFTDETASDKDIL